MNDQKNLNELKTLFPARGGADLPPTNILMRLLANSANSASDLGTIWRSHFRDQDEEKFARDDLANQQVALLRELSANKIDPQLFDLFISNELDRSLKRKFAMRFFVATLAFTLLSYLIIVLNSVYNWGISQIAITALIIETPLQFIGLLYIIARNLFPQSARQHEALTVPRHNEDKPAG